jgi:hypothetical protein
VILLKVRHLGGGCRSTGEHGQGAEKGNSQPPNVIGQHVLSPEISRRNHVVLRVKADLRRF